MLLHAPCAASGRAASGSRVGRPGRGQPLRVVAYLNSDAEDVPIRKAPYLHLSLYHRVDNLPEDGKELLPHEEYCNPERQRCKDPVYVYETKCHVCSGTGATRGRSSARRGKLASCTACTGLGYVRLTLTTPHPERPPFTIARPSAGATRRHGDGK